MTLSTVDTADQVRSRVQPAMRALLDRLDQRNRLVAGYQIGFWDADGEPAEAGGKGLRPALALLSARAAGAPLDLAVPAAVSVELVHTFSLLHDDLIDADTERRHRPTAWAVFGPGPALLAGDALQSLAYDVLIDAPNGGAATRRLGAAVARLTAGQAADLEFEGREAVGLDECLRMAADKTGALISCACTLGALICGAPADLVAGLSRFGEQIGLAFQLVDDLLGIWGEPERTGKPVGSDLAARKWTVPTVRAATSDTPAGREFALRYREKAGADEGELARLIELSGAREWTTQYASRRVRSAISGLDRLELPEDVRRELANLAVRVVGRDH
ncbi:polyprenyl synthetase family protein [Rhizomonospora bruguierae]|uniref:polyprenyl synthetase family protein n=1 Tax=Rhizomonospora bruguierae TaxID=1581705 RepID=UPI001BCEA20C|nr:polyprenyl synthetase family protein [Micromonospora sp. NBRC 107566]